MNKCIYDVTNANTDQYNANINSKQPRREQLANHMYNFGWGNKKGHNKKLTKRLLYNS